MYRDLIDFLLAAKMVYFEWLLVYIVAANMDLWRDIGVVRNKWI